MGRLADSIDGQQKCNAPKLGQLPYTGWCGVHQIRICPYTNQSIGHMEWSLLGMELAMDLLGGETE